MVEATSVLPAAQREERERQEEEEVRRRVGSSSSGSTEYIAEKRNGDIRNAEYQKTVVEQTPDGFVKRERDTYVTQFTSRGFRNAVYDRRVEYYNREGELVRVETFGKHKRGSGRGSMRVYKTGETRYDDGRKTYEYSMSRRFKDGDKIKEFERNYATGARREKDYREPPKRTRTDTVYEFESGGKFYRTGSAVFVEQKTGIDPRKLDNETIVLRDTKTGKSDVFRVEGRDERNPKQAGLAVRVQKPTLAPTNRAPVITAVEAPFVPRESKETPSPVASVVEPSYTPPEGDYGGNITFQPEVPDISPGGARFKDGVYQGQLTEAPESYKSPGVEDRLFRIREQADFEGDLGTGAAAFVGGVFVAGGSFVYRAFTRPFETGTDVVIGTVSAVLNPTEAIASIKARPEKFIGENIVLAGIAKGVAKVRSADVAKAVEPHIGEVVTPERAVALRESGASSVEVRPVAGEQQAAVVLDAGGVRVDAGVRRPVEVKGETVPVEDLTPPEYYSFTGRQTVRSSVRPDIPPGESSPASGEPGVLVKDALVESTGEVGPAASNVKIEREFRGEVKASEVGENVRRFEVSEGSAPLGVRGERVGTAEISFQPFEVRGGVPGYPKSDVSPPGPTPRKLPGGGSTIEFRPALEFFEERLYAEAGGEVVRVSEGSSGTVSVTRTPVRVTGATPPAPGGATGFSYFVESPGPGGSVTLQEQRVEVGQPVPEPPRTATTDLAASGERGVDPPQYEVSSPSSERGVSGGPRSPREGETFREFYESSREARGLNRENFRSFSSARPVIGPDTRSGSGSDLGEQQRYEQEQFQQQEIDVTLEQGQASGLDFSQQSATDQSQEQRQESRQQQGLFFGQLSASGSGSAPPRGPRAPAEKPPKKPPIRLRSDDRERDARPSLATAFVRRGGVFRPVAVGSVADVTEKASKVVRSTAAASFRVVERGKPVGFSRLKSFIPSSIFRAGKTDPSIAVQKRKTRISSPGERFEIRPKRKKRRLF